MQTKATQLFWSQTQCHLESVLLLNIFSMGQAGFQIGAGGSSFDSLLLLKPRFDWIRAESKQHQFENLSKILEVSEF